MTTGSIVLDEGATLGAEWLAYRYDPTQDCYVMRHLPRASHRGATFLTDEYLGVDPAPVIAPRRDILSRAQPAAPMHFIFHSAFCCSTLLARAFDLPGVSMGLKEPLILNDLMGWKRRGGVGPDMASVIDDTLRLLARPFGAGEAVVVKPSTVANALAAVMLTLVPDARAILLHAPLRTFLTSIAKKEIEGRLWIRTLLTGMLDDGLLRIGFSPRQHLEHTDLQVAALTWLGQQALFADLTRRFGPGRVRSLDSATLMQRPREAVGAVAELFRLSTDSAALDAIVRGPAFTRHSKSGRPFTADDRSNEHRSAEHAHQREIDIVIRWAQETAKALDLPLDAPAPLLS